MGGSGTNGFLLSWFIGGYDWISDHPLTDEMSRKLREYVDSEFAVSNNIIEDLKLFFDLLSAYDQADMSAKEDFWNMLNLGSLKLRK